MPPFTPSPEHLAKLNLEWVEPYDADTAPANLTFATYETKVRGAGTQGSYWYRLPPGYSEAKNASSKYPVLYWLHGGMAYASQGAKAVALYTAAMEAGQMPPTILVLPQGLPVGWYLNSIDGTYPIEDVLIRDLLPHVDSVFRTSGVRGIEGFSMGGYGALHLGLRYHSLFLGGGISAIAPAILASLANEPKVRIWDTFRGSQAYYDENHPVTLVTTKAAELRAAATSSSGGLRLRLLSGGDDLRLTDAIARLSSVLDEVGVPHERQDVAGAGHEYDLILAGLGDNAAGFWSRAFGQEGKASAL
ncbi:hypothetical protein SCUCBS95973_008520 [Sporothrix curviconia]|uniref:Uncharacterized protein n=1 Tax=Sporothrix curviconia TaxID=1260050 RepID=A0ABP0CM88_9PEZI